MDSRQQRVAKNEALFREVNERIKDINEGAAPADERSDFLCECGDQECTKAISLSVAEYEAVRSDPRQFAIVPGHQVPDVERLVADHGRFAVVEKEPAAAARIAEERDPRS
jgi:hypothetical protein